MAHEPPEPTIDVLEAYRRILSWTAERVSGTRPAQFTLPTPCVEWNVTALLRHLFGTVAYYALLAEHGAVDTAAVVIPEVDARNHGEAYRRLADQALRAWSRPGALSQHCHHPIMGQVTGTQALSIHAADNLVHGWDVARATAQPEQLDPECAVFALRTFERVLHSERSRRKHFLPAGQVGPEADEQTRLIAFTGRMAG